MSERRIKASPARDLAEMLRSFDYAVRVALQIEVDAGSVMEESVAALEAWGRAWYRTVGGAFVDAYCDAGGDRVVPADRRQLQVLLDAYTAERAARELLWEVDHRPDLAHIPLEALQRIATGATSLD